MKKKMKRIIGIMLLCIMVFSLWGCSGSKESECAKVIAEFQTSCNEMDATGMLNCINPTISDPLKAALAIGSMLTSQDLGEELAEIIAEVGVNLTELADDADADTAEIFESIKIAPVDYDLSKKAGTVTCTVSFTVSGAEFQKTVDFSMVKKDDAWYISGMKLNSDS